VAVAERLSGEQLVRSEIRKLLEAGEITPWEALDLSTFIPPALADAVRAKSWSPEIRAECVRLHVEEGMSCTECAEATGVAFTTVKAWLWPAGHSARKAKAAAMRAARAARASADTIAKVSA
jgi:hypothetical protein